MKPKLSIGLCIVISLVLIIFGLLFGTIQGYADERAHVTALLDGDNGLLTVLDYRAADGLNLCVVARRHLTDDEDVATLETTAKAMRAHPASLTETRTLDEKLEKTVENVVEKLRATPSFQSSSRDVAYLDMLSTDLKQLRQNAITTTYNEAATAFNAELEKPVSGFLAKLLGVKPCELYQ